MKKFDELIGSIGDLEHSIPEGIGDFIKETKDENKELLRIKQNLEQELEGIYFTLHKNKMDSEYQHMIQCKECGMIITVGLHLLRRRTNGTYTIPPRFVQNRTVKEDTHSYIFYVFCPGCGFVHRFEFDRFLYPAGEFIIKEILCYRR